MKTRLLRLCWVFRFRIIALVLLLLTALKAFAEPVDQPPPEPGATAVVLNHAELTEAIDDDDARFFELSFAVTPEAPRATEHPEEESR